MLSSVATDVVMNLTLHGLRLFLASIKSDFYCLGAYRQSREDRNCLVFCTGNLFQSAQHLEILVYNVAVTQVPID